MSEPQQNTAWKKILRFRKGITSVIGSGGKTTLLRRLSEQLDGTVLLCTSTHILPFEGMPLYTGDDPDSLSALLRTHRIVCTGVPASGTRDSARQHPDTPPAGPSGETPLPKLHAPALPFSVLETLADYVIVEADGSKRLPLKAHANYEPVIPAETKQTILVVGASGLGKRIADAVHRPEIFCGLTGLSPDDIATPEAVAEVIRKEHLADTVFVNQADTDTRKKDARRLAGHLSVDSFHCVIGSLI